MSVEIQKFPIGMTGAKYRKQLGVPSKQSTRAFSSKSFKIAHKFKGVKKKDRLKFLKRMAEKLVLPRMLEETKSFRAGFNQLKVRVFPMNEMTQCYCCPNIADVRHHVVQLQHGGRNKKNNIVPLCNPCHCKVHPHLQKDTMGR
jgi:5-methylcytosine-specific restriction endonuclease McrA